MTSPRVSVIMPCYNSAAHVARSIRSVLMQTYADFELIVVDNSSSDGSADIVAEHGDVRIRLLLEGTQGVSYARNRGLAEARGEFVAFLDSDDTWEPAFLQNMCTALEGDSAPALAYCGWQNLGLTGGRGEPFVPPDYETNDKLEKLIASCRWPIHAALTRRRFVEAAGGFDVRFVVGEDFLLWMEIACFNPIRRVPEVLAYYHHHGGDQATKNRARAALETRRVQTAFLDRHPEIKAQLGQSRVRALTHGNLLREGYSAYWQRDLDTARTLFREVMKAGYGGLRDWRYMLPAWLPSSLHASLIHALEKPASPPDA